VKPGVSDALVGQIDLLRSFAALTRQTVASGDAPDSLDMLSTLTGQSRADRPHLVEQGSGIALRVGRWKYIEPNKRPKMNANTNTELGNDTVAQLYDLAADRGETRNVADRNPSRVKEMQALLEQLTRSDR
jgi:arylsulfatase A-like enzyme